MEVDLSKTRGWFRIGVAIYAIYAVIITVLFLTEYSEIDASKPSLEGSYTFVYVSDDFSKSIALPSNIEQNDLCINSIQLDKPISRSNLLAMQDCDVKYPKSMIEYKVKLTPNVLLYMFFIPISILIFILLAIKTIRWIVEGFNADTQH